MEKRKSYNGTYFGTSLVAAFVDVGFRLEDGQIRKSPSLYINLALSVMDKSEYSIAVNIRYQYCLVVVFGFLSRSEVWIQGNSPN